MKWSIIYDAWWKRALFRCGWRFDGKWYRRARIDQGLAHGRKEEMR